MLYHIPTGYLSFCVKSAEGAVEIPDCIRSIGNYAFSGCKGITSVRIPDSVAEICAGAFADCTGLTAVELPDYISFGVTINQQAFSGCTSLQSVPCLINVNHIPYQAFSDCIALTDVTVPGNVTVLESRVFSGCSRLKTVVLEEGVHTIAESVFEKCTNLTDITIPRSVTTIYRDALRGCPKVTVRGYRDTEAESYAKQNNLPFIDLETVQPGTETTDETTTTTTSTTPTGIRPHSDFLYGDADCSGDIRIGDAILLARYLAEDEVTLTAKGKLQANCFDDGSDRLNADDLQMLIGYLAGSLRSLPVHLVISESRTL